MLHCYGKYGFKKIFSNHQLIETHLQIGEWTKGKVQGHSGTSVWIHTAMTLADDRHDVTKCPWV